MDISFDSFRFRLGKLCKHGHTWKDTGMTLRYQKGGRCAECMRAAKRAAYPGKKEQILIYRAKWYEENRDRALQQKKDYYQLHREQKLAKDAEYRQKNCEKIATRNKQWYEEHKEAQRAYARNQYYLKRPEILKQKRGYSKANRVVLRERWNRWRSTPSGRAADNRSKAKRKALKLNNHHVVVPVPEWLQRIADFGDRCAYCNTKTELAQDHFIPLSQGGCDVIGNLIPACQSCNSSKNAIDPKVWYFRQPFFKISRWRKIIKVLGKKEGSYNQLPLM